MKLPRGVSGDELIRALRKYGYQATRQTGSHIRLTSIIKKTQHHITIPRRKSLALGTLNSILNNLAGYLEMDKETLVAELFGQ